jgi:hypothetical protein
MSLHEFVPAVDKIPWRLHQMNTFMGDPVAPKFVTDRTSTPVSVVGLGQPGGDVGLQATA